MDENIRSVELKDFRKSWVKETSFNCLQNLSQWK